MPRMRKHDKVSEYHVQQIARRAKLLRMELDAARNCVKPFNEHYNALLDLNQALIRCENILRGLPPDHDGRVWNSTPGLAKSAT
jgi:hypothetical protein